MHNIIHNAKSMKFFGADVDLTWSHMFGLGEYMSIFKRRVASLAAYFPFFMFSNSFKESATGLYVCMHVCMYVCMYVYVYMSTCMYIHLSMYVCMYASVNFFYVQIYMDTMYVCMYVCTYMCMYVCIYACMAE